MIIVKLMGGLGNQLFQYAAGRAVSIRTGMALKLDVSYYQNQPLIDTPRVYDLSVFNTIQEFASSDEVRPLLGHFKYRFFRIKHRLIQRIKPKHKKTFFNEESTLFHPEILKIKNNVYLVGYWVSEKYFLDSVDTIRKEFTLINPPDIENQKIIDQIKNHNAVAIHVRRGDYITNPHAAIQHGLCPLDYYERAVQLISSEVEAPVFVVFSDDSDWVKANLKLEFPTIYMTHNPPDKGYEDLRVMTNCKHFIIANSTFSWWGAWLGEQPDSRIIAPLKWNSVGNDSRDIIPDRWRRI